MKLKDKLKNNEKIQKIKEYKESFDILWSNPKSHAAIVLAFWFVMILILSLFVRLSGTGDFSNNSFDNVYKEFVQSSDGVKEYLKSVSSYRADVYIDDKFISVTDVRSEELLIYDGSVFYYKDALNLFNGEEFVVSNDKLINDVSFFNIYNVYKLISDKNEDYITKFNDGSYLIVYSVSLSDFMLLYDNSIVDSDVNISVKFSGFDGVDKIEIDLSQFYDKIVIDVNSINSIDSIEYGGVL